MKSWVDVLVPGRHGERHRLSDEGSTVGSGAGAAIKLTGAREILPVHCQLRPLPEGCWIELIETAPEPFSYEGKPSRGCLVSWGHDVFIGSVRLTVDADGASAQRKGPSPIVWAAAVAIPVILAMTFLAPEQGAQSAGALEQKPPPMFGDMPGCSEDQAGAIGRAVAAEQIALAKHERGVFELVDGVTAVQLMREAATCYALGNNQGSSDRALDRAEAWIADLQFSYKRALLDLETGRREGTLPRVLEAVRTLQVLLVHAPPSANPFKQYLNEQRLRAYAIMAEPKEQS